MFSLTVSCCTEAHGTSDGKAAGSNPVGIRRVYRAARVLTAEILVVTLAAFIWATSAHGQVLYGSMVGNVTDPNGAAVPGAKVEVVNLGTRGGKSTTTDENGSFSFSDLTPGVYNVTVTAASFKKELRETVQIDANKVRRVDAQLQVGEVQETVVIGGGAEIPLQTDRGDVNATLSARQVNNLPLFGSVGRNYQSLIYLIPGTTRGTGGFFINQTGTEDNSAAGNPQRSMSFNVNGVSRLQNNTKLDGSSIIYPWLPTNGDYLLDARRARVENRPYGLIPPVVSQFTRPTILPGSDRKGGEVCEWLSRVSRALSRRQNTWDWCSQSSPWHCSLFRLRQTCSSVGG